VFCVCLGAGPLCPGRALGVDDAAKADALWKQMRAADIGSADHKAAKWKLTALLGTMPVAKRTAVATAMMDRQADPAVNAAALELFGTNPLPLSDVQRILWDSQRTFAQRELLKTYYSLCRPEAKGSLLSEATRRQLVAALAERLDNLAGTPVHYGEQRLFVHVCSSLLTRYGRRGKEVPQAQALTKALEKYAEKAGKEDRLGAAIPRWLDLLALPDASIGTFSKAVQVLGHWEPVARLKAASYLAELIATDDKAGLVVLSAMADPRDEIRAGATRVFGFARSYRPEAVVPKLMAALTKDSSVVVQAAAADALIARSDQIRAEVAALLGVLTSPARRLGSKRTSSMLRVLARLIDYATEKEKAQLLRLARLRLRTSSDGALAVLEAMGSAAAPAVPDIRDYRDVADRSRRNYIDRHVLPAILPTDPGTGRT
jgi:hypothetical protein